MSHALGEVIIDGEVVGYYEYNGTCDTACPSIWDSADECLAHWRTERNESNRCTCGKPPVPVIPYSSYGEGFYWWGTACLSCNAITGGASGPYDENSERIDGHPFRASASEDS